MLMTQTTVQQGLATHYGCGWHGKRIGASGVTFYCTDPIAAHRTLPFGTIVKVTNKDPRSSNYNKSVLVMIFDRGPYAKNRIIDMSPRSLHTLAGKKVGGLKVQLEVVNTTYQCSFYACLKKLRNLSRVDDKKLSELLSSQ